MAHFTRQRRIPATRLRDETRRGIFMARSYSKNDDYNPFDVGIVNMTIKEQLNVIKLKVLWIQFQLPQST